MDEKTKLNLDFYTWEEIKSVFFNNKLKNVILFSQPRSGSTFVSNILSKELNYDKNFFSEEFFIDQHFIYLKHFIKKHDNFLEKYVFSLILDGQVKRAINQIKNSKEANFFEAKLLIILDYLTKKKYEEAESIINELLSSEKDNTYEFVILKSLESYNYSFLYKKIKKIVLGKTFGF